MKSNNVIEHVSLVRGLAITGPHVTRVYVNAVCDFEENTLRKKKTSANAMIFTPASK